MSAPDPAAARPQPRAGARSRCAAPALAAALALAGCASLPPPESQTRHIDLLARRTEQVVESGSRIEPELVDIGGDVRSVLFQHPPSRVALGSLPDGAQCWFRFSPGLSPNAWGKSDGVVFQASVRPPGAAAGEGRVFYREAIAGDGRPADAGGDAAPGWIERTVRIPGRGGTLILETLPGAANNRDYDWASWAAPFLLCDAPREGAAAPPRPHIVLVSIDTLRPDHLGAYGYRRPTSPNLDALAAESVVFTRAFSTSNWTLPSHASLFTGLPPHRHGAGHRATSDPLGPGPRTLAELLAAAGYRTAAFTAGGILSRRNGLDRGFEQWHEATKEGLRSAMPAVLASLDRDDPRPLFLFLHTYDAHGPYAAYPIDLRFLPDAEDPRVPAEEWSRISSIAYHQYQRMERFRGLEEVVSAYDSGIRHVDAQLGRLFAHLDALGMDAHTLLVVTSDHGETLYERNLYVGHSFSLRDEEIRIPLLVRLPGAAQSARSDELVSLEDLMPLILEVAGLPIPEEVAATSPLARLRGEREPRSAVFGESSHTGARFARSQAWKVIVSPGAATPQGAGGLDPSLLDRYETASQGYDLEADPQEQRNLWGDPESALALTPLTRSLEGVSAPAVSPAAASALPPDELQRLRELGYTQ